MTSEGTRSIAILHVIPWPVFGGPHNEALTVGTHGIPQGWRLTVVLPLDGDAAAARLESRGIKVIRLPLTRLRRTRSARFWVLYPLRFLIDVVRLARLMRREEIDLVEGSSVNLQAALAGRIAGAAVVWRLADISSPMSLRRAIGLVLPAMADVVLVNGRATLPAYPGISRATGRVSIYYPTIDDLSFARRSERESVRRSTLVIGMVANINPDKGVDVFVEATGLLARRPELRFLLVGAEHDTHREYARRIHQRVTELGLEGRFEFTGERVDVASLMQQMDIFVISSNREGSTTTAIEAMASGLPIVATDVGAVGEVVADGETGVLVQPGDAAALAAAVETLVDDATSRARLAKAGRARFDREFDVPEALNERARTYRQALARRHRRGSIGRDAA